MKIFFGEQFISDLGNPEQIINLDPICTINAISLGTSLNEISKLRAIPVTINCQTESIWEKEYSKLRLSIEMPEDFNISVGNTPIIYVYYTDLNGNTKTAFLLCNITEEESIGKVISFLDLSEVRNIINIDFSGLTIKADIKTAQSKNTEFLEKYNIDAGMNIFVANKLGLSDEEKQETIITKDSYIKYLLRSKCRENQVDDIFDRDFLTTNDGEKIYRNMEYRVYNPKLFLPTLNGDLTVIKSEKITTQRPVLIKPVPPVDDEAIGTTSTSTTTDDPINRPVVDDNSSSPMPGPGNDEDDNFTGIGGGDILPDPKPDEDNTTTSTTSELPNNSDPSNTTTTTTTTTTKNPENKPVPFVMSRVAEEAKPLPDSGEDTTTTTTSTQSDTQSTPDPNYDKDFEEVVEYNTYGIGCNEGWIDITGIVGYTDYQVKNNIIRESGVGYQSLSDIPNLMIRSGKVQKGDGSYYPEIWPNGVKVVDGKRIYYPALIKENDMLCSYLYVSSQSVDINGNIVVCEKQFKIKQSNDFDNPWWLQTDDRYADNIEIPYHFETEYVEGGNGIVLDKIPVIIYKKETVSTQFQPITLYTNDDDTKTAIEKYGLNYRYEFLEGYETETTKSAKEIFDTFFNINEIKKGDIKEGSNWSSLTFGISPKTNEEIFGDENIPNYPWYPFDIDTRNNKNLIIKVTIELNLPQGSEILNGTNHFETSFIVMREPNFDRKLSLCKIDSYGNIKESVKSIELLYPEGGARVSEDFKIKSEEISLNSGYSLWWFEDKNNGVIKPINSDNNKEQLFGVLLGNNPECSADIIKFKSSDNSRFSYENPITIWYLNGDVFNPTQTENLEEIEEILKNSNVASWKTKLRSIKLDLNIERPKEVRIENGPNFNLEESYNSGYLYPFEINEEGEVVVDGTLFNFDKEAQNFDSFIYKLRDSYVSIINPGVTYFSIVSDIPLRAEVEWHESSFKDQYQVRILDEKGNDVDLIKENSQNSISIITPQIPDKNYHTLGYLKLFSMEKDRENYRVNIEIKTDNFVAIRDTRCLGKNYVFVGDYSNSGISISPLGNDIRNFPNEFLKEDKATFRYYSRNNYPKLIIEEINPGYGIATTVDKHETVEAVFEVIKGDNEFGDYISYSYDGHKAEIPLLLEKDKNFPRKYPIKLNNSSDAELGISNFPSIKLQTEEETDILSFYVFRKGLNPGFYDTNGNRVDTFEINTLLSPSSLAVEDLEISFLSEYPIFQGSEAIGVTDIFSELKVEKGLSDGIVLPITPVIQTYEAAKLVDPDFVSNDLKKLLVKDYNPFEGGHLMEYHTKNYLIPYKLKIPRIAYPQIPGASERYTILGDINLKQEIRELINIDNYSGDSGLNVDNINEQNTITSTVKFLITSFSTLAGYGYVSINGIKYYPSQGEGVVVGNIYEINTPDVGYLGERRDIILHKPHTFYIRSCNTGINGGRFESNPLLNESLPGANNKSNIYYTVNFLPNEGIIKTLEEINNSVSLVDFCNSIFEKLIDDRVDSYSINLSDDLYPGDYSEGSYEGSLKIITQRTGVEKGILINDINANKEESQLFFKSGNYYKTVSSSTENINLIITEAGVHNLKGFGDGLFDLNIKSSDIEIVEESVPQDLTITKNDETGILSLTFPKNRDKNDCIREIKLKKDDTIITIVLTQLGFNPSIKIGNVDLDENQPMIAFHSSGYCLGPGNGFGYFQITADIISSEIYNELTKTLNLSCPDNELIEHYVIDTSTHNNNITYTVFATIPPNYSPETKQGKLVLSTMDNKLSWNINYLQGYITAKVEDNHTGKVYSLSKLSDGKYLSEVGNLNEPILYPSKQANYKNYFFVQVLQREVDLDTMSFGDELLISNSNDSISDNQRITDSRYAIVTYEATDWGSELSKFFKDGYDTDLYYSNDTNSTSNFPRLIHKYDVRSEYEDTEVIIEVNVKFKISKYKRNLYQPENGDNLINELQSFSTTPFNFAFVLKKTVPTTNIPINLMQEEMTIPIEGGDYSASFKVTNDAFNVADNLQIPTTSEDWIIYRDIVAPADLEGLYQVYFTVKEYKDETIEPREGEITLLPKMKEGSLDIWTGSKVIKVKQNGRPYLIMNENSYTVDWKGGKVGISMITGETYNNETYTPDIIAETDDNKDPDWCSALEFDFNKMLWQIKVQKNEDKYGRSTKYTLIVVNEETGEEDTRLIEIIQTGKPKEVTVRIDRSPSDIKAPIGISFDNDLNYTYDLPCEKTYLQGDYCYFRVEKPATSYYYEYRGISTTSDVKDVFTQSLDYGLYVRDDITLYVIFEYLPPEEETSPDSGTTSTSTTTTINPPAEDDVIDYYSQLKLSSLFTGSTGVGHTNVRVSVNSTVYPLPSQSTVKEGIITLSLISFDSANFEFVNISKKIDSGGYKEISKDSTCEIDFKGDSEYVFIFNPKVQPDPEPEPEPEPDVPPRIPVIVRIHQTHLDSGAEVEFNGDIYSDFEVIELETESGGTFELLLDNFDESKYEYLGIGEKLPDTTYNILSSEYYYDIQVGEEDLDLYLVFQEKEETSQPEQPTVMLHVESEIINSSSLEAFSASILINSANFNTPTDYYIQSGNNCTITVNNYDTDKYEFVSFSAKDSTNSYIELSTETSYSFTVSKDTNIWLVFKNVIDDSDTTTTTTTTGDPIGDESTPPPSGPKTL